MPPAGDVRPGSHIDRFLGGKLLLESGSAERFAAGVQRLLHSTLRGIDLGTGRLPLVGCEILQTPSSLS